MKKIVELRTKLDVFILKHMAIMGFITVFCICPWVTDGIEWIMEKFEDFCEGPLNMSYRTSEEFATMVVLYTVIVGSNKFITWSANYIVKVIKNHKKTSETSDE